MPIRRTYRYRADPAAKPNLQAITCAGNRIDSRTNRKNHRMGCVVQSRMTVSTKDAFKVVPQRNQEANPKNGISASKPELGGNLLVPHGGFRVAVAFPGPLIRRMKASALRSNWSLPGLLLSTRAFGDSWINPQVPSSVTRS